jgi:hypothetical protein
MPILKSESSIERMFGSFGGGVNLDMIPPDGVGLKPCFCGGWIDVAEAV